MEFPVYSVVMRRCAAAAARQIAAITLVSLLVGACAGGGEVPSGVGTASPNAPRLEIIRTRVIAWPVRSSDAVVQVIVEVRNSSDGWIFIDGPAVDADQKGVLLDSQGRDVSGYTGLAFSGYPRRLAPGAIGYYVASKELSGILARTIDGADFTPHIVPADGPPAWEAKVGRTRVEVVRGEGVEVTSGADWNGSRAIAAIIAFNRADKIIGFVEANRGLRSPGRFTLCCLPPGTARQVADTTVIVGPDE